MRILSIIKGILAKKTVLKIALVLCVCIFVASAIYIGIVLSEMLTQERIASDVGDLFDAAKEQSSMPTPVPTPTPTPENDDEDDLPDEPVETEWQRERRLLLEAEEQGKLLYADILEINKDFLGMIEIPGIIQRLPFVMSKDNKEYLDTDFEGSKNSNGTIFLSMYNDRLFMDNNSTIFGHYTKTGHMFTRLHDYKNAATFAKAPVIVIDGLIGESIWVIFAAHVVEPELWYMIPYSSEAEYAGFLDEILARSLFITDVDITTQDKVITLSVCDYTYEDMRFVVHARKLREGEVVPSEVIAETNPNRKGFEVPHQVELGSVNMSGVGFAVSPNDARHNFYVPLAGKLERYFGDSRYLQGPFLSLSHNGISQGCFIAVEIVTTTNSEDDVAHAAHVAIQGLGGEKGISIFTSPTSRSYLSNAHGRVTPEGVDARFPSIQNIGNSLWLLYSVPGDEGSSLLYRQPVLGGESQLLAAVQGVSDARPLGVYTVNEQTVVIWHEASSNRICGARVGIDESFLVTATDAGIKVQIYGDISSGVVKTLVEQNGSVRFSSIDLNGVPTEPSPMPEPDPAEDSDANEDLDTTEDPDVIDDPNVNEDTDTASDP